MNGWLTLLRNQVRLNGTLDGLEFFLEGTAEIDQSLIQGVWYTPLDPSRDITEQSFGCFVAVSRDLSSADECTLPSHHPLIQYSGALDIQTTQASDTFVLTSQTRNVRATIIGAAALAAVALTAGLWNAWLRWRQTD